MVDTDNQIYPFGDYFPSYVGEIELPFRDGAHQAWDNERLGGLPVIYSRGDEHWVLATSTSSTK